MARKTIIKKADRIKFLKDFELLAANIGFQKYPADVAGYDYRANARRVMTDFGVFLVHQPDADFGFCSINGAFEEPQRAAAGGIDCNPYSGKWNILTRRPESALGAFTRNMGWVNARPLRPGELDEADAIQAAELAKQRASWDAYLAAQVVESDNPKHPIR